MIPLFISVPRLILFLVLVQSASLYKIYAFDDNHSNLLSDPLSWPLNEDINQVVPLKNIEYEDDVDSDTDKDNVASWLSLISEMKDQDEPLRKRSIFPKRLRPSKAAPQQRNARPHWNPLVAAYKRCGELSRREDRESCFKDAIQMLFVHKLRK